MRQRRSLRRSIRYARANCSASVSVACGVAASGGGAGTGAGGGVAGSGRGVGWVSSGVLMGCAAALVARSVGVDESGGGSVGERGPGVAGRIPIHLAVAFDDVDRRQAATPARPAGAAPGLRLVGGTMGGAQDEFLAAVEELAGLP